ncbi:signal transduction histidine kinase [Aurantimicrobium minutum]|uniref:sensor histidine kinase n=1 Tax=Aurantimicrobium minutum TaxID=708131 RepID=UPI0024748443|nr:HAMP domain-containing sensor histidine kinase [Aurantimicrobium minutum]MDH6531975.1 signal transduction histidine kinase [Aurantimicrobium minutum]
MSAKTRGPRVGLTRAQLLFVPAVHPRYDAMFRQLPFAGFFLISLIIFGIQVPEIVQIPALWVGALAGLIATVLTIFNTKLINDGDNWITIVPILDYIALSCVSVVQPEIYLAPMILLSVIPALWLGSIERTYGFVLVLVMSGLTMLPSVIFHVFLNKELEVSEILALLLIPAFSGVAAGTMHSMTLRTAMKEKALLYQEARLERTVIQERESNRLLDSVVQAVGRGLLVIDAQGNEILINKLMRAHPILSSTELGAAELEHHGWFFGADKETPLPPHEGPVSRSLRGESFTAALYWVGDPSTHERYALSITSRPLKEADGTFLGAVLALQDVTNFMDALEAKDTFISTVSHELRTPLTSITGYLELIRDEQDHLPSDVKHYLDVAERNTQRLLLLVTDLLTVARSERGEIDLNLEQCDVGQIVDEAMIAFQRPAEEKNITLTRLGLTDLSLNADRVRLAQVVENLISNGIKYTPEGGAVTVSVQKSTSRSGAEIIISDTGMGIPLEEQSQLFTKFYRALAVRNGSIPGMGLGLSICQKIVESHGGQLTLESEPSHGTTVTVFLPAAR